MRYVLFVCNHDAGRSQMAQAFFERLAPEDLRAESAGTEPAKAVWPEVVDVMQELGIDLSGRKPTKLTREMQLHADWAITMGCGDACPYAPTTVEDWDLQDPAAEPIEEIRGTRDTIEERVERRLLAEGTEEIRSDRTAHELRLAQILPRLVDEFQGQGALTQRSASAQTLCFRGLTTLLCVPTWSRSLIATGARMPSQRPLRRERERMTATPTMWRRLLAEFLGSAFLAALVVGSGIAAQTLSPGNIGLQLFENAAATAAGLFAIILMFGPVSGGHSTRSSRSPTPASRGSAGATLSPTPRYRSPVASRARSSRTDVRTRRSRASAPTPRLAGTPVLRDHRHRRA